jgi:hypothetical protein
LDLEQTAHSADPFSESRAATHVVPSAPGSVASVRRAVSVGGPQITGLSHQIVLRRTGILGWLRRLRLSETVFPIRLWRTVGSLFRS